MSSPWNFAVGPNLSYVIVSYLGGRIAAAFEFDVKMWALKFNLAADGDAAALEFSGGPFHLTFAFNFHGAK